MHSCCANSCPTITKPCPIWQSAASPDSFSGLIQKPCRLPSTELVQKEGCEEPQQECARSPDLCTCHSLVSPTRLRRLSAHLRDCCTHPHVSLHWQMAIAWENQLFACRDSQTPRAIGAVIAGLHDPMHADLAELGAVHDELLLHLFCSHECHTLA